MIAAGHAGRWQVDKASGTAEVLHALDFPIHPAALIWIMRAACPALVVGSAQSMDDVDLKIASSMGYEVTRRRSGGGAVLVVPGSLVWIDVVLPRSDALWNEDVGRAMFWLGEVWAEALAALGHRPTVNKSAQKPDQLARQVCFAGIGAGEVLIGGQKVVGISQRRIRAGARFQCACVLRWDPSPLVSMLRGVSDSDAERLGEVAHGVETSAELVTEAFLGAMSQR